ncbi:MAG TPA: sugar-binding transcriptional regulator [Paenirhodobacter sp.]
MKDDKKLEQAARAAWLSYVAGRTQDEIAQEMGVSRQTAQRLVAQAMTAGLVKVRIDHPLAQCLDLAQQVRDRFGLRRVEVSPALAGMRGVAMAVADLIETQLSRRDPITLAIGTGRHLRAGVAQMSRLDCPQHRIVSLTGNIAPDGSAAYYNVLFSLSELVTARSFPLMVPVIATTAEEREAIHRQPGNIRVMQMARTADIALIGLGSMGPDAPIAKDGFLTAAEVMDRRAQGAVGELLGNAYDIHGQFLPGNERVASARLPPINQALIIAAASGAEKIDGIIGALHGRLINGLITDETTAKALLDH